MERKKNYIVTIVFLLSVFVAKPAYKTQIYNAYISNRMNDWQATIDKMEENRETNTEFLLQLINYQYGFIAWCIGNEKNETAEKYLKLAERNLEWLEKSKVSAATINAYKSAFYGFKIGLSPIKAPFLGPKSVNHSKLSMELDPSNPLGYIQYGNAQFYMPPVFGGSKKEALKHFLKALKLMEAGNDISENWNYLSLLALIGQSFEKTGQPAKAKMFYEKALTTEPGFLFVKDELYPGILKKIKDLNE